MQKFHCAIALLATLAAGCRTTEQSVPAIEFDLVYSGEPGYSLVILSEGPNAGPMSKASQRLAGASFRGALQDMTAEGRLLVSGILARPRLAADERIMMIFLGTTDEALAAVSEIPAIQTGTLRAEAHPFSSVSPFEALPSFLIDNATAETRCYMIATLPHGQEALDMARDPSVVLAGQTCGSDSGEWWIVLDAQSAPEAWALLNDTIGSEPGSIPLRAWWSSEALVDFAHQ